MKIVWTEPAVEDLRELHSYIARDSELYASEFISRIISVVQRLAEHPQLGGMVPEANEETIRELLYRNYRIIYRITTNRIELLLSMVPEISRQEVRHHGSLVNS